MYGKDFLCVISKGTFEIAHIISYPYIERYNFYSVLKFKSYWIKELLSVLKHPLHCSDNKQISHCSVVHILVTFTFQPWPRPS